MITFPGMTKKPKLDGARKAVDRVFPHTPKVRERESSPGREPVTPLSQKQIVMLEGYKYGIR